MLKNVCLAIGAASAMSHHHHHHRQPMQELVSLQSDPICSSAGCDQYMHPKGPEGHPVDYFVPNLGVDKDILDNHASLETSEEQRKHHWTFEFCEKDKPCNPALWTKYNKTPELSDEVKDTQESIGQSEEVLGKELTVSDVRFVDSKYTYAD